MVELVYFDGRGVAEGIRLTLVAAGVDFKETHLTSKEQWHKLKPTLTYAQVPVLRIDGKELVQSRAAQQYVARKHHLYGKNDDEAYEIDAITESIVDFQKASTIFTLLFGDDPDAEKKTKEFEEGALKKYFGIWDQLLAKKGNSFFVGNSLTLADVNIFNAIRNHKDVPRFANVLNGHEHLAKFYKSVEAHPNFAKYLSKAHPYPPTKEFITNVRAILH